MKHVLLLLIFPVSCAFMQRKGDWGKNALYPIKFKKIQSAFIKNATDPFVWVPMVGAGVIHYAGYDRKLTNWASGDSLIFRDDDSARKYSDTFVEILEIETYASILLTPSWDEGEWDNYAGRKIKGTIVTYLATTSSHSAATQVKNQVRRHRPDGGDHRSFPSGHAADAGGFHKIIRRNLNSSGISIAAPLNYLNTGLVVAAGWARVEAKAHFPSDVLVGYAVGNFVSGVIYDSLMNLDEGESFVLFPTFDGGASARYTFSF